MSGRSKAGSSPSRQSKGGLIDGTFTLKGAYGFLKEAPAWILPGAVPTIILIQVLWMAGGKLDLAVQIIQMVDRLTLLVMAIYQMLYIASFYVQLGGPGYLIWRFMFRLDEGGNRDVDVEKTIRAIALLTICMDAASFLVISWIMFIPALFIQISVSVSYRVQSSRKLNGKNNKAEYGWVIENPERCFERGEFNVVSIGLLVIIVASLTSGSWFASQDITYKNESQHASSSAVDEVLGENGRGVIVLKEGRVILLKRDVIVNEEFCKQSSRFGDDNETLYVKIRGSNIPDC